MLVADAVIKEILEKFRTVAVVGLSRNPSKDSYGVAEYLLRRGYRVVPINPIAEEILGEKSYKGLLELPEELKRAVEIVDIFRPSEDVLIIVEEAVKLREEYGNPQVIWMQEGIVNEEAARLGEEAGMTVVMDACIMMEHIRLVPF